MAIAWTSRGATGLLARATTRRCALGLLGGLTAIGLQAAGLQAQEATPAVDGGWSFTDDTGKTVTLPQWPTRIVADLNAAAPLWDFGIKPVAVSGWTVGTDAAWGNVDRATPNITASAEAPDPDLEAMIGLEPDLFVTIVWGDEETPYSWSFLETEGYEQADRVAPVIVISGTGRADENLQRFVELAELLDADPNAPELIEAKAAYDERVADFSQLAREKADLASLFVHADADRMFVANPDDWADLAMYQDLGLTIITPDAEPKTYWEELGIEQAAKYQPDILFQSTRQGSFTAEQLAEHPTIGTLPAIEAGQIGPWNQDFIQSYQGLAAALEMMSAALGDAQDVTP